MKTWFVTGAGTEIGKTHIAAAMLRTARNKGARVRAVKPLMSGFDPDALEKSDAGVLLAACGRPVSTQIIKSICLHQFVEPVSPHIAARAAGVTIEMSALVQFTKSCIDPSADMVLVEGAGGVLSPATETEAQADLAAALGLRAILVTSNYLGAISHTLTAMEALDRRGVGVDAIIVSQPAADDFAPDDLAGELRRWRREPILAAPHAENQEKLGGRILSTLDFEVVDAR